MGLGQWLKDTGTGLVNGAKQFGADIIGVGHQVLSTTLSTGQAILDGTYTALTDPKKFASDVKNNIGEGLSHVTDSWSKGADTIATGWSEMKDGRTLWNALGKTVDGVRQIASMGISDAIEDHLEETMEEHRDELGNVIGYTAKEGTDYITKRMIESGSERRALVTNSEEEIAEAIAEGDTERVTDLDKKLFAATTGKDIKKAAEVIGTTALVVGSVAAAIPTGGASVAAGTTALAVVGSTAGQTVAKTAATKVISKVAFKVGEAAVVAGIGSNILSNNDIALDEMNIADDISDAISEQVEALKSSGRLSDDQVDKYTEVMSTYYRATCYNSLDPDFAVNNGFESNEQMRDFLLSANGLPTLGESASMSQDELDTAYASYYGDMSGAASLTQEGAELMGRVAAAYAGGQLTRDQYTIATCRLQCEAFDMTDDQKDAYAAYASKLCLGRITEDQFYETVANDPITAGLINSNGEIELQLNDYGEDLLQAMSEADAAAFAQPDTVFDSDLAQRARDLVEQGPPEHGGVYGDMAL